MEQTDWKGASKWKLDTPCLVVDQDKLERNIRVMQSHVERFGKKLRPYAKTHKCSRVAGMQMEAGAVGICVAKVSEAEVLVRSGLKGTLITSPVVAEFKIDNAVPELTDLQAGSYTLMDAEYLGIGSLEDPSRFEKFSPALTLLTSVVNVNHDDHVTVDAGLGPLP